MRVWKAGLGIAGMIGGAVATGMWIRHRARSHVRMGMTEEAGLPILRGGPDSLAPALWQSTGVRFQPGNAVDWYFDGEVFSAVREQLRQAQRSVRVAIYIWQTGDPGKILAEEAAACARRGVRVQIVVDPLGSEAGFDAELRPLLEEAGCEVHTFRSFTPARMLRITGRHHRKLIIVDDEVAFTGGFGIAPQWSGHGERPGHWRDTHVRVEGPVVSSMIQAFAASWLEVSGEMIDVAPPTRTAQSVLQPAGESSAAFVSSREVAGWTHSFWLSWFALNAAHKQLWVANAYFVPPAEILEMLCRKATEGVDVRLLLPGPHIDHVASRWAQHSTYPPLLAAGVRIFEYQPSMMHAKTILVDGRLSIVGSINLDPFSLYWLEEGALVVDDVEVARGLASKWEEDLAASQEILRGRRRALLRPERWGPRSLPRRLVPLLAT